MEVNSVLDSLGLTKKAEAKPAPTGELDRNTFLRLFITQLENQNPLNPQANEEFVAQLAQFTSLEQATQTTALLEQLIAQGDQRARLETVGLIGHEIEAAGNTVELVGSGTTSFVFDLLAGAKNTSLAISDLQGNVVQTLTLGPLAAGRHEVQWDGLTAQGTPAEPGIYQFSVLGVNSEGLGVGTFTYLRESVRSALWENGQAQVLLGSGRSLTTSEVLTVF